MKQPSRAQSATSHCTFCDLIRGAAEVSVCHEDSDAIAFMDIQPVNNGHVLVVPREHYESLLDVPEEIGMHLFRVTMRLANAVRKVTGSDDLNIVVNSGAAAGQDEPHYHVHIIPRRHADGFDIPLPFNGSEMPDRTVLDACAAQIISALRDPMRSDAHSALGGSSGIRTERQERPIPVPVFADSARKATVDERATHDVGEYASDMDPSAEQEGAHGELLRQQPTNQGDSA
jgi:histidine triad (HIT) family protein